MLFIIQRIFFIIQQTFFPKRCQR